MTTILYFSPTGNVKHLAILLSEQFGTENSELHALEFTDAQSLAKTDQLIIIYSIHAFNAPRTVRRFVKALPADLCKSVSLLAVGCNETWINSASNIDIRKMLEHKGYSILLDEVLAMPLTFVTSFPEPLAKKMITKAESKIIKISNSLNENKPSEVNIPIKSKILQKIGRSEDFAARQFGLELHATKSCVSCGICVENCPEKNIHFNSKKIPKFGFSCMMCMRCIYECPEKAITPYISKFVPIKNGYSLNSILKNSGSYKEEVRV